MVRPDDEVPHALTRVDPVVLRHHHGALRLLGVLAWLGAAMPALAADAAPKAGPCASAEHRQFDFWRGSWEVRDAKGKRVGSNRIDALYQGCALQENWNGAGGHSGTSLNVYDADTKRWHQTWVDNGGGLLLLDGELVNGSMVLAGDSKPSGADAKSTRQRITWTPLPDGRVRQLWESSEDRGGTWTVVFDGYYTKLP